VVWYRRSPWAFQEMLLVLTITLVIYFRMWLLGRRYFWNSLNSISTTVSQIDPTTTPTLIPLHTVGALASLEKSFNDLTDRTAAYRHELNNWIAKAAEDSRLNAMGEMASLVFHDLSSPLLVIRNYTEMIADEDSKTPPTEYKEPLKVCTDQALSLLTSLRAYLRHGTDPTTMPVGTALAHTQRILLVKYSARGYRRIAWQVDAKADSIVPGLPSAELLQVLDNLLSNSAHNLLENNVENPRIHVSVHAPDDATITLALADNGTGLSQERFETLTGLPSAEQLRRDTESSMGLRLVRRIVERRGGTIHVERPRDQAGTVMMIRLPLGGS
jgi:signal transduction histidine kinase